MTCFCQIIPGDVLARFANDDQLHEDARAAFHKALAIEADWRALRDVHVRLFALASDVLSIHPIVARTPDITVYDCHHGTALPGTHVLNPGKSRDATAKRACEATTAVARFYKEVFNRNSVNNRGMTLQSSIHYGADYNNAFWNGQQMTYGDGDKQIFIDFTLGNDVIAHELTHGVTQSSAQFAYVDQAGGLNESMSDVFGSMFRQWQAGQTADKADWLIGHDILGPAAKKRGLTCLRNLADPADEKAISRQPAHFQYYEDGMDPHLSSGVPNLAFQKAAVAIGGKSWEKAGQVWYKALTGFPPAPNMTMKAFADRTRDLARTMFPAPAPVAGAIDAAWKAVGL
jgi:Zn-dependent metalloprotease